MKRLIESQIQMFFGIDKELSKENYIKFFDNFFITFKVAYSQSDQQEIQKMIDSQSYFEFTYDDKTVLVKVANLMPKHPHRAISDCTVDLIRVS